MKLEVESFRREPEWVDEKARAQSAIIKTLAYAGVFNYPLRYNEIWRYFIFPNSQFSIFNLPRRLAGFQSIFNSQFSNVLKKLERKGYISQKKGYYFLKGFESGVEQRRKREKISLKKIARAKKFKNLARFIPTVKLIGISGALAMRNAHEEDDIDLFVVAKSGTVWITRFLMVILAEVLGVRRRPDDKLIRDKICLNMFADEENIGIPEEEQDLFSAHEVAQMRPIYEKDNTYSKFIYINRWVREYLPNALQIQNCNLKLKKLRITSYGLRITTFIEKILKNLQLFYMRRKRTNEVLNDGYLRFHPVDSRRFVLRKYRQILAREEVNS